MMKKRGIAKIGISLILIIVTILLITNIFAKSKDSEKALLEAELVDLTAELASIEGRVYTNYSQKVSSILYPNYSCPVPGIGEELGGGSHAGYETSQVLTTGKHTLQFQFGSATAYAYNQAEEENQTQSTGRWVSPGWSNEIINVVEYKNNSKSKYVNFSSIQWSQVKKAGLQLGMNKTAGFESNYGHLLLYSKSYKKAAVHMFVKAYGKKNDNWFSDFLTTNESKKIPSYNEREISFNHSGAIEAGIEKDLGYYTNITYGSFTFPSYIGLRGNVFSEKWKILTNITTPTDLQDIGIEYIFALNPSLTNITKKVKYVRLWIDNGTIDNETNLTIYQEKKYELNQLIDKSGSLPNSTKQVDFLTANNETLSFFDFKKEFNLSQEAFWKIQQVTLPNGQTTYVLRIRFNFGSLNAGETLSLNAGWVSPTGHVDPGNAWFSETYAYDDNTGNYAYAFVENNYLELTLGSAISSDKVRAWFGLHVVNIVIDVYYSSAWNNIYSGSHSTGAWIEYSIGSTESVTKARIKEVSGGAYITLSEFDFNEVAAADTTPPNITLISPSDNSLQTNRKINFTFNATTNDDFDSCALWTNETSWSLKELNKTPIVNASLNWINDTFSADGTYLWNIECNDTIGNANFSSVNWTVNIDTIFSYYISETVTLTATTGRLGDSFREGEIDLTFWYGATEFSGFPKSVTESLQITELITGLSNFFRAIAETLNITDFIIRLFNWYRTILETFSFLFGIEKKSDLYLLDLKDPTQSDPEAVSDGDNITVQFNFTKFDNPIIENVTVLNISIGGQECTILTG